MTNRDRHCDENGYHASPPDELDQERLARAIAVVEGKAGWDWEKAMLVLAEYRRLSVPITVDSAKVIDCQCDPDVWGPDGLERGTGHNPICPAWVPA